MNAAPTLYVAGPMTGLPEFNYPAFRSAAVRLSGAGFTVEDPSTNVNPTPDDYHGWLRAGLAQLIRCDGVALLDGWEASGGARLEVNVAATLGMRVRPVSEWMADAVAYVVPDMAVPDGTDIAEHLDTCEGYTECAERAWCEWCQADTIPIRGCCHECNQPVGRSTAPDRIQEH